MAVCMCHVTCVENDATLLVQTAGACQLLMTAEALVLVQ